MRDLFSHTVFCIQVSQLSAEFRQQVVKKDLFTQSLQSEKERFKQQVVEKNQFIRSVQSKKTGFEAADS